MQPSYIPWLGYFDLIDAVDSFILLDDVKVAKSSWNVRNRIRSAQGETMLSVPVSLPKTRLDSLFTETKLNNNIPWRKKHLKSIEQVYRKTDYFDEFFPKLEKQINASHQYLIDLNEGLIFEICNFLNIDTPIYRSSALSGITGVRDDRLTSICISIGADEYYSPKGSAAYLDIDHHGGALTDAGIRVVYQDFSTLEYNQKFAPFIPYLSIIDAIFNCGAAEVIELIRKGRNSAF